MFAWDASQETVRLRRRFDDGSWSDREVLEPLRGLRRCPDCEGDRLRPESRAVRVKGHYDGERLHVRALHAFRRKTGRAEGTDIGRSEVIDRVQSVARQHTAPRPRQSVHERQIALRLQTREAHAAPAAARTRG